MDIPRQSVSLLFYKVCVYYKSISFFFVWHVAIFPQLQIIMF